MKRTLAKVGCDLSWQPTDGDGAKANPGGTVTVTVTRADGTAVVTGEATSGTGDAPRTYSLAASDNQLLDMLTITWLVDGVERATTYVEIVGGLTLTVDQLLAIEPSLRSGANGNADVVAARIEVERFLERACNGAFFPQYRYERATTEGGDIKLARAYVRAVRSIVEYHIDGSTSTTATATELGYVNADLPSAGWMVPAPASVCQDGGRVKVGYEFGLSDAPEEIVRVAGALIRMRLNAALTATPDRANSFVDAAGTTIFLSRPNEDKPTGVDWIDEVIIYWRRQFDSPGLF